MREVSSTKDGPSGHSSLEQQCAALERVFLAARPLLSADDSEATADAETETEIETEIETGAQTKSEDRVLAAVGAVAQRHEALALPPVRRGSKYLPHLPSRPGSYSS